MTKRVAKSKPSAAKTAPKEKTKRPADINQPAHYLVAQSTAELQAELETEVIDGDFRVMASLGRKSGKIGGKRPPRDLTQEKRSEIACKAAEARWAKRTKG